MTTASQNEDSIMSVVKANTGSAIINGTMVTLSGNDGKTIVIQNAADADPDVTVFDNGVAKIQIHGSKNDTPGSVKCEGDWLSTSISSNISHQVISGILQTYAAEHPDVVAKLQSSDISLGGGQYATLTEALEAAAPQWQACPVGADGKRTEGIRVQARQ